MTEEYILETRNLFYTYDGNVKPSMNDVSIRIRKGVKTVILGANGAGKSTLFYHFNGVVEPDKGKVLYEGQEIGYRKKQLRQLRSKVAVVLQNPDDQIFGQTVESDIAYGPSNMKLPKDEVDARVEEALFQTGLAPLRKKNTMQLSYGQRKRLALAGALAMKPDVLVMDEPTAGLDPQMALELMELADQLHHQGVNIVVSTHDVDLAYAWAEDIHVLRRGVLIYSGRSEEFYSDPVRVHMTGVMQPSMFVINKNLCDMRGVDEAPYPRTETQLISKMASGEKGMLNILSVGSELDKYVLDSALERTGDVSIGLFGTATRRLVYDNELPADFVFNGFESCAAECLLGNNALLLCDESCLDLIESKIRALEGFGSLIEHRVL